MPSTVTLDYNDFTDLLSACGEANGFIKGVVDANPHSRQAEVGRPLTLKLDAALSKVIDRAAIVAKDGTA